MKTAGYDLLRIFAENPLAEGQKAVRATAALNDDSVSIRYEVVNQDENVNSSFSAEKSNWGLWEFDVVEVFLSVLGSEKDSVGKYFEFQVSPLNQFFELEITKPRVTFNKFYRSGMRHTASKNGERWSAEMIIPFRAIGMNEGLPPKQLLVGNFFACLGKPGAREYFSAFLPLQEKPDFHLPEFFRKIF